LLIGILSDTHDRLDAATLGVEVLRKQGAQFFIHCGDVGSRQIIDLFVDVPSALVWGNNDWDRASLGRYCQHVGVNCHDQLAELNLDGKAIAVTHGDVPLVIRKIIESQQYDYLMLGHSHVAADTRNGRVRIINPGALHRASVKSVAILDTAIDAVRFYDLGGNQISLLE
jgi:uncharacterized protein